MLSASIGVLVVDQHPVTRWGLEHVLESQTNIHILGEAASIREALDLAPVLKPEVTILDAWMPGEDGVKATRQLARNTETHVLGFSGRETWDCVESFLRAGGMGFVTKKCPPEELISAVLAVAGGRRWISPSLRRVCSSSRKDSTIRLSPREQEVARLVTRGLTSRQIADQLCVSIKTVETHRYRIFKHLNIKTRAQLVNYIIDNGLL